MSLLLLLLISVVFSVLSVPQTWLHLGSFLPDHNDSLLITYIINQVQLNILHHQPLYWGSFFAPFTNTLTFSEPFITSALISLPLRIFGLPPIVMFNFNLILGFVLTSIFLYLLIKNLTKSTKTALLGSLLFTFSGVHLSFLPHLQVFNIWLLPLGCLFFLKFLDTQNHKFLYAFLTVLLLQLVDSVLVAYFLGFISISLFIYRPIPIHKKHFVAVIVFLLVAGFLISPYLQLNRTFPEATRPIRDAAHFSLNIFDPITQFGNILLVSLFVISFFINKFNRQNKPWFWISILGLILSLGPVLKWNNATLKIAGIPIPLPYTLFYYLVPGFQGMRTPSRWIILAGISAVIFISIGLYKKIERTSTLTYCFLLSITLGFLYIESHLPISTYSINTELPTAYEKVKLIPKDQAILEMPIKLWNMPNNEIESLRSIYSLEHQHRRLNGYSGFAPLGWIDLVNHLNAEGLTATNTAILKKWGITYVLDNNKLLPL